MEITVAENKGNITKDLIFTALFFLKMRLVIHHHCSSIFSETFEMMPFITLQPTNSVCYVHFPILITICISTAVKSQLCLINLPFMNSTKPRNLPWRFPTILRFSQINYVESQPIRQHGQRVWPICMGFFLTIKFSFQDSFRFSGKP